MLLYAIKLTRSFSKRLRDDHVSAFSAQAAFFLIISFFPFAMFLLTLLNYLPFSQNDIFKTVQIFFPATLKASVESITKELLERSSGTVLSITAIAALWSASKGFYSVVHGLDSVSHTNERRNYLGTRLLSAFYTLLFALLLIAVLFIFGFGNQIYLFCLKYFPILSEMALLVISVRTIVGMCLMILFFSLLYSTIPQKKLSFFSVLPGAILSATGWIGFSYLFSFYIDNFSNYSATYGSLTAIVLSMLWLYACMYIVFIGAEINQILSNPMILEALHHLRKLHRQKKEKHPESKDE